MTKNIHIALIIFVFAIICSCGTKEKSKPLIDRDLTQIKNSDTLVALTLSSSTSYFIYKGEPMGYAYELLKDFADSQGLKLEIKVAENIGRLTEMLQKGEGDLIAYNIPITNDMKASLLYCGKETINEQVLVQRANKGDTILKDVTELIGKEVWVVDGSKYHNRLVNLNNELGGGVIIKDIGKDTISVEDLIGFVAKGTIPYTFSDKDIAMLNKTYYPKININLIVSHPQRSSWAVRKSSPQLANTINEWFKNNQNTPRYNAIVKRYFEMSKIQGEETVKLLSPNQISIYDHIFKKYAPRINWDWRLLASLAYQESRFDTTGVSWAGAVGLMGLMPGTAKAFGLNPDQRTNPDSSVNTAIKCIQSLNKSFAKIENEEEKLKFVLAAYNAGIGHITDAQALTAKYGKDPETWNGNVEEYLKLKNLPEYYNDEVCKSGYFRGTETLNYVDRVLNQWKYYQEKVKP